MFSISALPITVLSAEALAGSLISLGHGFAPLMCSSAVMGRCVATLGRPQHGVVLSGASAVWAWGARRTPPLIAELSVHSSNRVAATATTRFTRREISFQPGDVVEVDQFSITSPARTIADMLAQHSELSPELRISMRVLLLRVPGGRRGLQERLMMNVRMPHRERVLANLEEL